ncbi:hypothetical protein C2845_PM18G11920 [Panicum miliaceum]|uniref:At1g61320/AtMIF1 LRR domain-containing protein n=1 Tax=Panicum miliaceum TaxID=4540 RepID=A0A3L6PJU6_PANMI|nr:hypothetical protein C2845_PM18G11920 [Panicum miliaceum]
MKASAKTKTPRHRRARRPPQTRMSPRHRTRTSTSRRGASSRAPRCAPSASGPAGSTCRPPSLGTLHLTRVTGRSGAVQRLVSSCPRLADLTLEACEQLAELDVPGARLRRLALRCCHDLAAVAADSSELRAFEYRGAVPAPSLLTLRGGGGARGIASCKLDFCGAEATDPPELARLAGFLQLFAGAKRLHLTSARLGCGAALAFSAFPALRHSS